MMNRTRTHALAVGLSFALFSVFLLICPPGAFAQNAQDIAAAQERFDEAIQAYQAEAYPRALELFQQAYARVPDPVFLYNAARVAEKMGALEQALELATRARAEDERPLPAPLAEKNSALIKSLDTQLSQARQLAAQQSRRTARQLAQKQRADAIRVEKAHLKAQQERERLKRQRELAAHNSAWSWVGYSGLGIGIAGGALIGGATYLGSQASADIEAIQDTSTAIEYSDRRDQIESTQSTGRILLYSGVGLVAVGSAMLIWELTSTPETPVSISIAPGPGHTSVSLSGAF